MSDTMRDAPEPLKIEPGTDMHLTLLMVPDSLNLVVGEDRAALLRYAKRVWQAAQSQPAPPVPQTVQEITRLIQPYVAACLKFNYTPMELIEQAEADVNEAFKPIESAITALVEKNHELQFSLDGVNAMRRPEWISVDERLPEQRDYPYQVVAIAKKAHGKESCYPGEGIRRVQQDWVIRQWPQNFTHWMTLPPSSTPGIEPEQGESHDHD